MFEQNEIMFFGEIEETHVMGKPPNSDTNPACGTPNPPPWCDGNAVRIDMYLSILVIIAVLIKIILEKI